MGPDLDETVVTVDGIPRVIVIGHATGIKSVSTWGGRIPAWRLKPGQKNLVHKMKDAKYSILKVQGFELIFWRGTSEVEVYAGTVPPSTRDWLAEYFGSKETIAQEEATK